LPIGGAEAEPGFHPAPFGRPGEVPGSDASLLQGLVRADCRKAPAAEASGGSFPSRCSFASRTKPKPGGTAGAGEIPDEIVEERAPHRGRSAISFACRPGNPVTITLVRAVSSRGPERLWMTKDVKRRSHEIRRRSAGEA